MKNGWETYYDAKYHYVNDKLHNDDGPAVIYDSGSKAYYNNNLLHRLDGPAQEFRTGIKRWWFEGKAIKVKSQEEFENYLKHLILK